MHPHLDPNPNPMRTQLLGRQGTRSKVVICSWLRHRGLTHPQYGLPFSMNSHKHPPHRNLLFTLLLLVQGGIKA
ncbi:hypothetical protein G7K_6904-t1 [Saitoella complicata NRRL Y-17804]|uniref:Uncharacterized protein n=1 Tax=Saitoella complicata (strain BCRC 22490 / CBS 7301 / JCM 7358 / NBRC 10748 / NRRL Y-17804) TaxID=698492 RepID=A0A0E9NSV9_SAICN|nr:hypothetical protein G7K_6904-t1 [Saitoella complicata NRRL Y-17804]